MAWTSNSFKVAATQQPGRRVTVSPEIQRQIDALAARAEDYADTQRKRLDAIKDFKLRESVSK